MKVIFGRKTCKIELLFLIYEIRKGDMMMELFNIGAGLASFVGLFFTCYNVYQVWNIKKAIKKYSEEIDLSSVLNTMCETSDFIENIRTKNCLDKDDELEVDNVIKSIHEIIGLVEGVNKIYFKELNKVNVKYYDAGYYNDIFFNDIVLNAKNKIIILGKRNTRVTKQENKVRLFNLLDTTNIYIDLFYFNPESSEEFIENIRIMSPSLPRTNEEVRKSQEHGRNVYIEMKEKSKRSYAINYYEYRVFPSFNFVVVDKYFYWGIVNYPKTTNQGNPYDLRPYIKFKINDRFPKYILSICEVIKKDCEESNKIF